MTSVSVAYLLDALQMWESRAIHGLDQMPDDRLSWSPGEKARNPLELIGKWAGTMQMVAVALKGGSFPERRGPGSLGPAPATREEARASLRVAFGALREAVGSLTAEDLERKLPAPWGEKLSVEAWLWWVPAMVNYHQGQLNYLQLAYGDGDPNIPPDWLARAG